MTFVIVGLGNPGSEYENTRHNTGRIVLDVFRKMCDFPEWVFDKKLNALVSVGEAKPRQKVMLVLPHTFMNKSGDSLRENKDLRFKIYDKKKKIKEIANLVVIHDDLDIPFGSYKISFNKSSGGHKGVESIIRAVKTQAFVRVRVGISPLSPLSPFRKGSAESARRGISFLTLRKPKGDSAAEKTILGKFAPAQLAELKTLAKRIAEGLVCLITEGREKAMSQYRR